MKVIIRLEELSVKARELIAFETDNADLLAELSKDKEVRVRRAVAANKNTGELILDELANDNDDIVRYNVANNVKTSSLALDKLSRDKDVLIRAGVAHNEKTSEITLNKLASDNSYFVRQSVLIGSYYKKRKIYEKTWKRLAEDPCREIRSLVATKTSDEDLLKKLSEDESEVVRKSVLANLEMKLELRVWIVQNCSIESMKIMALDNFNWPDEILIKLLDNLSEKIRLHIVKKLTLSEVVLEKLAEDPSIKVRVAVVNRQDTTINSLMKFADSEVDDIRVAVVSHPKVIDRILVKLAKDTCPEVREMVAEKIKRRDILKKLSYDSEEQVRLAVVGNGHVTLEILRRLRKDKSEEVKCLANRKLRQHDEVLKEKRQWQ